MIHACYNLARLAQGVNEIAFPFIELLNGQRVMPQRLLESGYEFRYPALRDALEKYIPEL